VEGLIHKEDSELPGLVVAKDFVKDLSMKRNENYQG
jgi:hypothetical protein